jgi:hypothetical protein
MRYLDRSVCAAACLLALLVLPMPGLGEEEKAELHDCGERICGEWKPKGENTCRTCTTAQCRKQGDQELLAGDKKETECYQGHGEPPKD